MLKDTVEFKFLVEVNQRSRHAGAKTKVFGLLLQRPVAVQSVQMRSPLLKSAWDAKICHCAQDNTEDGA